MLDVAFLDEIRRIQDLEFLNPDCHEYAGQAVHRANCAPALRCVVDSNCVLGGAQIPIKLGETGDLLQSAVPALYCCAAR